MHDQSITVSITLNPATNPPLHRRRVVIYHFDDEVEVGYYANGEWRTPTGKWRTWRDNGDYDESVAAWFEPPRVSQRRGAEFAEREALESRLAGCGVAQGELR